MERVKVHTYHSNGNDIICKSMNAERVNEHILYISEDEKYGNTSTTYYYLIVEHNGIFVELDRTNTLETVTSITFDQIIESFKYRVEHQLYFNKLELLLCKTISEELYTKALSARNHALAQRKEEARIREEKRKAAEQEIQREKELEKAQRQKERKEKRKKDELFFKENSDILKSNLSSFEKLTAINELNRVCRWNDLEAGASIVCSVLDLIRKYNHTTLSIETQRYARNGELLETPKSHYHIGTSEDNSYFRIPAKLGKLLTFEKVEQ